jgi:hypothetical protein
MPCRQFVSASLNGAELVMQNMELRSAKAVARPGIPFEKLDNVRY